MLLDADSTPFGSWKRKFGPQWLMYRAVVCDGKVRRANNDEAATHWATENEFTDDFKSP